MEVELYALPMNRAVFRDESDLIDRIVEYVDTHFADGISLRDVAIAFAYSPAHLTYRFRLVTGKPLTAWIIECRILAACRILENSDATIGQICGAVGFVDLCYFTRQFRRLLGIAPAHYRSRARSTAQFHSRSQVL